MDGINQNRYTVKPLYSSGDVINQNRYTVKPLYSNGHHQDLKKVSVIGGARYIVILPRLASFTSKTYSRVIVCLFHNKSVNTAHTPTEMKQNLLH